MPRPPPFLRSPISISQSTTLPLRSRTSAAWAATALADPLALLDDHAHLERKAATNALALLHRWPSGGGEGVWDEEQVEAAQTWARALTAVARDEVEHLRIVLRLLRGRGRALSRLHRNAYATALRRLVREGRNPDELLDRLLISALIEARSCERFERLASVATDPDLARLYRGLYDSEHGHYRVFLDLARRLPGAKAVEERWNVLLEAEAEILAWQHPGPRMHSGEPSRAV